MTDTVFPAIPARGGSKRLPRKNVREMAGKPMIAYTIQTVLETDRFGEVYVATDDEEIAAVAREYGATVPTLLPDELCGDLVPSYEPCLALGEHLTETGALETEPDTLLCLQPTSPLRTSSDMTNGLTRFENGDFRFLMSVTHIDPHYFHWALQPSGGATNAENEDRRDEHWEMYFGEEYLRERPELPDVYRPNGSVKIADIDALRETSSFFGEKLGTVETPPERSIHVGTAFEFTVCERLLAEE